MTTTMWEFETARFKVIAAIIPEEMDPADSFDDETSIQDIRLGNVDWFAVDVVVLDKMTGYVLGGDQLGGCAYTHAREFFEGHRDPNPMNRNCSIMRAERGAVNIVHYFPDMVRIAIGEARKAVANWPAPPALRTVSMGA